MIDATPTTPRLLLSAREAARALGVSEKHLWTHTIGEGRERGVIPCVRLGNRVLYSPADLEAWIEQQREQGAAEV